MKQSEKALFSLGEKQGFLFWAGGCRWGFGKVLEIFEVDSLRLFHPSFSHHNAFDVVLRQRH